MTDYATQLANGSAASRFSLPAVGTGAITIGAWYYIPASISGNMSLGFADHCAIITDNNGTTGTPTSSSRLMHSAGSGVSAGSVVTSTGSNSHGGATSIRVHPCQQRGHDQNHASRAAIQRNTG